MRTPTKLALLLSMLMITAVVGIGGAQTVAQTHDKIALQLDGPHQAQSAGFYAADQNDYYADERLTVTFLESNTEADIYRAVLDGSAQFGIAGVDTLLVARAAGYPVRALAILYRRSSPESTALADPGTVGPNELVAQNTQVSPYKADALFTTDQLINQNPELVERFLQATLNGWRWAIEYPEEAGLMAQAYDSTLDADHLLAVIEANQPLIQSGEDKLGWMRAEDWEGMQFLLLVQGMLDEPVNLDAAYTTLFLEHVYGNEP